MTPSTISGVSNFKSNITDKFGLLIKKGLNNSNDLINLVNQIKYLGETKPYMTVNLSSPTYSDGSGINVGDILYMYTTITIASSDLIGAFVVKEIENVNGFRNVRLELNNFSTGISGLEFSISKFDNITNSVYLFKNNVSSSYVQANSSFYEESKYTIEISNPANTSGSINYYLDYSSSSIGTNTNVQVSTSDVLNFYKLNVNSINEGRVFLCSMTIDSISSPNYIFYLTGNNDNNVTFDMSNYYYFAFKQDSNGDDDLTKGISISNVTINSRFFTPNSLDSITLVDGINRGYKYSNMLYVIMCMYLNDELKTASNSNFNNIILKRLFLIASKINQLTNSNSNNNVELESGVEINKTILKLTYFADTSVIFNSSTIINELFTESVDSSINTTLISGLKEYLSGKVITLIDPFFTNISINKDYSSKQIHTTSTNTTYFPNFLLKDSLMMIYYKNS